MSKLLVLGSSLDAHIKLFDGESKKHKRLYRALRYMVFGLTAASAVLAGAAAAGQIGQWSNVLIICASALIGLVTSIEGLRKPSELWIHERGIYHALHDLKREVEFEAAGNITEQVIEQYFERLQNILSAGSERWGSQIVKGKSADAKPGDSADGGST